MKRAAAILSAGVCVATLCGCNSPTPARPTVQLWTQTRTGAALQLADEHVNDGRFDRARALLVAHQDAGDCRMQMMLVRIDLEQGKYAAAASRLETIGEQCGDSVEYADARGLALEGLGHWSGAAAAYEQAYLKEVNASRLVAWLEALASSDQVERACAVLKTERWRFPGEIMLHETAARLLLHAGEPDEAVNELATALLADPDNPWLRQRLAEAHMAAGQYPKAIPIWNALIDQSDNATERRQKRLQLAECQVQAGEYHDAAHTYRVLSLTDNDDVAALVGIGRDNVGGRPRAGGRGSRPTRVAICVRTTAMRGWHWRAVTRDLNQTGKAIETLALSDADSSGRSAGPRITGPLAWGIAALNRATTSRSSRHVVGAMYG